MLSPIIFSVSGNVIWVKPVFANTEFPIWVNPFGKVNFFKLLQFSNVLFPIIFNVSGNVIWVKPVFAKDESPILVNPSGRVILSNTTHPIKALSDIYVML